MSATTETEFTNRRRQMVDQQLRPRNIHHADVLAAMRTVPRHRFVPAAQAEQAYADNPLRLGPDQTISQPYIVALSASLVSTGSRGRVLEVGGGSGYQAAVLAELFGSVYTIEIDPALGARAAATLAALRYRSVHLRTGDGRCGWPEHSPYDAIVVAAATPNLPPTLVEQLGPGGRLVYPRGSIDGDQTLVCVQRLPNGKLDARGVTTVRFVPLVDS